MQPHPNLDAFRSTLRERRPVSTRAGVGPHASVAIVLAGDTRDLQMCFIRRAERRTDPWSGHMALPGGRVDAIDDSPLAAAQRETYEEVGVDLAGAEYLGALDDISLHRPGGGSLSPFAFYVGVEQPVLRPDPDEVATAFWFDVRGLWSSQLRTTTTWPIRGREVEFPGIQVGPGIVWGLTFRVLTDLGQLLGAPLPPPLVSPVLPGAR